MTDAIAKAIQIWGLIMEDELGILDKLCDGIQPFNTVVETGTYRGRTATFFAAKGATVFTLDDYSGRWAKHPLPMGYGDTEVDKEQMQEAMTHLLGNPKVFPISVNTYTGMPMLRAAFWLIFGHRKVDLCFLDGNHNYEVVKKELAMAESIVRPGGIIAGHDLDFPESVYKALKEHRGDRFQALSTKLWSYVKE